ncbi:MAG: iron ABC transporter permease [Bacteroidales bacterium]|nr:iron ABC transporter permease [Bacteroidales bacterium]
MTTETTYQKYQAYVKRKIVFIIIITFLLLFFMVTGLVFGSVKISLSDIISAITGNGEQTHIQIITNIRLPRVLSAILAGAALSVAGAAMQSILRNPLGSPFTLGISNAAAFGAAFAIIILGAGDTHSNVADSVILNNPYLVTVSAFAWSLVSTGIILFMAKYKGATPEVMILTGIVAGSLFMAGTTSLQFFADDVELSSIVFWTFGDLGRASWRDFWFLLIVVVPSTIYFIKNRWNYNTLNAGDETAKSLGVNVEKVRTRGMIIASLSTAFAVSFFGIIAFVGLVVPHIVRRFIGGDERFLIPASVLFGGMFLLFSDTIARTIISPIVLPVGILTSFLGAPLFIYLLLKGMKRR